MNLQNLSDIHTGRDTQGVQNDIKRASVRQERHVLHREDPGDDTLVSMTACHLITDRNLSLLRDIDTNRLVDSRRQFIAVLLREHLRSHNDSILTVRDLQRCVSHLSCLLAEDCTQKALFRCQLRLALRRYLADQDIAGSHFSANADDSPIIEVFQGFIPDARYIAGNFLRSELGVPRLSLILLNMN